MSGGSRFPAELAPILRQVGDELIPAAGGMPAAGSVLTMELVAQVFEELPDLLDPAVAALRRVDGYPQGAAEELKREDPDGLAAVGEVIAAAYFLLPAVADRLGYRRREAVPIQFEDDLVELTRAVVSRGWPPAAGPARGDAG